LTAAEGRYREWHTVRRSVNTELRTVLPARSSLVCTAGTSINRGSGPVDLETVPTNAAHQIGRLGFLLIR